MTPLFHHTWSDVGWRADGVGPPSPHISPRNSFSVNFSLALSTYDSKIYLNGLLFSPNLKKRGLTVFSKIRREKKATIWETSHDSVSSKLKLNTANKKNCLTLPMQVHQTEKRHLLMSATMHWIVVQKCLVYKRRIGSPSSRSTNLNECGSGLAEAQGLKFSKKKTWFLEVPYLALMCWSWCHMMRKNKRT